ncbi:MAG: DNA recombination protein RmuC [Clostridia bacterium]|nr:DNA recombination protein RmuC [Clostridia bacterium]
MAPLIFSILATVCALGALIVSLVILSRSGKQDFSEDFSRQRKELNDRMDSMQNSLTTSLSAGLNTANNAQMNAIGNLTKDTQNTLNSFANRMDSMSKTVEERLQKIQEENGKKLDEMQGVVNEKLESALEKRVTESFKLVNEHLDRVTKGLTEMQTLATGVGDLKKILGNVKTRGVFGETQASRILEQILLPEQYQENIPTVPRSTERVEFAVCLPGKDDDGSVVYLPIDSKFPLDRYEQYLAAVETGDKTLSEVARKEMERFIKASAKSIREKYVEPPYTTEFAILFLPTEGLYADVVRIPGLTETLMRDYSVNVAGPSTLAALLNSLQMGFKTLAIEKRSTEVWKILGEVKTEFEKFQTTLNTVKSRLEGAEKELDKLVGTRTNVIRRKLRNVEALPTNDADWALPAESAVADEDEE